MQDVKLPSGAKLHIQMAPIKEGRDLYKAFLKELKTVNLDFRSDVTDFLKNITCIFFSSSEIEACILECMKRCTVDGMKITDDLFEKPEKREDYIDVVAEVGIFNLAPFLKGHFAQLRKFSAMIENIQA